MKTHFFQSARLLAASLALTFSAVTAAHSATLFHETWQGLDANNTAASSGRWTMSNGTAPQLYVVENPASGISGKAVTAWHDATAPNQALPTMLSTQAFAMTSEGLEVTFTLAVTDATSSGYLRLGFVNQADTNQSYWISMTKTTLTVQKRTSALAASIVDVTSAPFTAGQLVSNQPLSLTLQIKPLSSTEHEINLLLNGVNVASVHETTNGGNPIPNINGNLQVIYGVRSPINTYLTEVTVASIPEAGTVALLLPAGLALIALGRRRTTTPPRA